MEGNRVGYSREERGHFAVNLGSQELRIDHQEGLVARSDIPSPTQLSDLEIVVGKRVVDDDGSLEGVECAVRHLAQVIIYDSTAPFNHTVIAFFNFLWSEHLLQEGDTGKDTGEHETKENRRLHVLF